MNKMYFYFVAVTVYFTQQAEDSLPVLCTQTFNIHFSHTNKNVNLGKLTEVQNEAAKLFSDKFGIELKDIRDVVLINLMNLGHMTETAFYAGTPTALLLQELDSVQPSAEA